MSELKLSDSASLHYEVHGEQGPWLVLVSGIGGHGAFWTEQVRHFSSSYRVVIHDQRGHGQSTGGGADSGIAQASSDVLKLLDELGADRVFLVGHSMGGLIVQQFALDHGDRVEGLVIGGSGAAADDYTRLILGFRQRILEKLGPADFCRLQTLLTVGAAAHTTPIEHILAMEERSLQSLPANDVLLARLASIAAFNRTNELGSPDYTSIIDERAFKRLVAALEEAREAGATIVQLLPGDPIDFKSRKIAPHIVYDLPKDCALAQREIFGPILPLRSYKDLKQVVEIINSGDRPLAIYPFSHNRSQVKMLIERTMSGGVSVNETLFHVAQHDMPFGGIGESGMGHYHGKEGFLTFSKLRPVFYQARISGLHFVRPPYGRFTNLLLRFLLR